MDKIVIYQILTRLFANTTGVNVPNGTLAQNGCAKFSYFTPRMLAEIKKLGTTHVWYTGILEHATQTDYTRYGIDNDHAGIVKGKAGSPYAVRDYYDVDPDLADNPYEFSNSLLDIGLTSEYNFLPYGTGKDYYGAKRVTPFLFGGIGVTHVKTDNGPKKNVFSANVPIGLGVKYKINKRMNFGAEWAMHFSLSDELDGMADPYNITSSGLFKNTDCYSTLQLTLTYSFSSKCRTCHNEDE